MQTIVIIDCHNICHTLRPKLWQLESGLDKTGIIYGFFFQIRKFALKFKTNKFVFCWDSPSSIRRDRYLFYKLRKEQHKTEEEIENDKLTYKQFSFLKNKILPNLGFRNIFYQEGYECDDIIANIVLDKRNADYHKVIVSNDNDLYQVLDYSDMFFPKKDKIYTKDDFIKEYRISPDRWIDIKVMSGDSSDNVVGIKGVGVKTSVKYINGNLPKKNKSYNLITNQDKAQKEMNYWLMKLPLPGTIRPKLNFEERINKKYFIALCKKYSFHTLINDSFMRTWSKIWGW